MKNLWTLTQRELGALFLSPIAYLVLIAMVILSTWNFIDVLEQLERLRAESAGEMSPMVQYIAYNLSFWFAILVITSLVTMRLLAEEKRSGTIEVLMTAPVTDTEVVLSKYLACVLFYATLWVPSILFLVVLRKVGGYEFDLRPLYAIYLGVLTIGGMFMAMGLFFSSCTRNQIVAAILTFVVNAMIFFTFVMHYWLEQNTGSRWNAWAPVVKYIAVLLQMYDLGTGKMDLKYLAYHLSVIVFMLFLTVKIVEVRKWR